MAGSAADTPAASTGPQFVRVSDADRDQAVDELKREFVDGRLSHETFMLRMQGALGARNRGQLDGLFTDLPKRRGRLARLRDTLRDWRYRAEEVPDEDGTRYPHWDLVPRAPLPPPPAEPTPLFFPPGTEVSFTIGRDQRCDLFVADLTVSRLHARLTRDGGGWLLADLGSTNGTRVNGWRVREPVPIRAGDLIRFGSASFVLREDLAAEARGVRGVAPPDSETPDGGVPSG